MSLMERPVSVYIRPLCGRLLFAHLTFPSDCHPVMTIEFYCLSRRYQLDWGKCVTINSSEQYLLGNIIRCPPTALRTAGRVLMTAGNVSTPTPVEIRRALIDGADLSNIITTIVAECNSKNWPCYCSAQQFLSASHL